MTSQTPHTDFRDGSLAGTLRSLEAARAAPMDVASRLGKLRAALWASGQDGPVDAILITDMLNIRYLTGFTGGAGLLAVTSRSALLVTDGRYGERAETDLATSGAEVRLEVSTDQQREAIASAIGNAQRIGLEANSVTWSDQQRYANDWFPGRELVATSGVLERLRFVKDAGEIARIRAGAHLADQVLGDVMGAFPPGATERELQWMLDDQMRGLGSEAPAFPTIVASGPNASLPHHRPTDRVIREGDLLLIDFGGTIDGYRSDVSRTFMIGDVSEEARAMFDLVFDAQQAGVAAIRDGVAAKAVDAACRSIISAAGRGDQFTHSTGHGVGLFIHEDPWIASASDDVLNTGHVVSVEPGVYVPGVGGVRIEDLVVVTETGAEVITQISKSPSVT